MDRHASASDTLDGTTPSACDPSRLSIPNDPFYVEPTCRYAAEVAHQIGFDAVLTQQISAGLRHALTSLLRYSFEPGEKASVELVCERIPAGLRISLRDRGLPLSAGDPGRVDPGADNPLYGLNDYFDEVHFHNRGQEGKEILLCKHLPDPSLAEYAAACPLDPAEASDAERPGAPTEVHCTVRR